MTTLTGIRDAQYLAQFLGSKIAIKESENQYGIYTLNAIFANKTVQVMEKTGTYIKTFRWDECENPYILLTNSTAEWSSR